MRLEGHHHNLRKVNDLETPGPRQGVKGDYNQTAGESARQRALLRQNLRCSQISLQHYQTHLHYLLC